jgi:3-oxoacyl-[acyl-carrier protein] reductase
VIPELADKVALVTGGSRGMGQAVAHGLSKAGALVAVNYSQDVTGAERVVREIERAGGKAMTVRADVGSPDDVAGMVRKIRETFRRPVQILINNAGVIPNNTGWRTETAETLLSAFRINAMGAVFCSQAVVPEMTKASWGRIINISSIYGDHSSPYVLSYSMSKAALDAITKALAVECAANGVTVNSVSPGNIDTAMTRRAGPDYIEYIEKKTPIGRLGTPDEVTAAVLFLCQSPFTTGTQVVVDGGLSHV